jgi:outer membrane protein
MMMVVFMGTNMAVADELRIGVVDLQKALQSVDEGKKAKSSLEKEFNEKKKKIEDEEKALQAATEEFRKKSAVLSEDARNRKQAELQERIAKYREMFGKAQFDIQNRERELTEPIINKLRETVKKIAEGENYTIVLERNENAVIYHLSKDDLTDKVISAYNK